MLVITLRKMANNKWMTFCLLLGFVLAVAMVSSIPIYIDGVLQRMLTKDLENHQLSTGFYPGRYIASINLYSSYEEALRLQAYLAFDDKLTKEFPQEMPIPPAEYSRIISSEYFDAEPMVQREEDPLRRSVSLDSFHDLEDHIELVNGRLFSHEKQGDVYEALVTEYAMRKLDLRLDEEYILKDFVKRIDKPIRVKVVGIFTLKDPEDPYWFQGLSKYDSNLFIPEALFMDNFAYGDKALITKGQWYYAFDYHKINLQNTPKIIETYKVHDKWLKEHKMDFSMPAISVLEKYYDREKELLTTLWMVQVPILLMLAFYLLMVSSLAVEMDKNEIAIIKSRGGAGYQVFYGYILEGLILGAGAFLTGPPLGLLICKLLGSANGFMEFVQRRSLPVSLGFKAYLYSLWAVVISIITMLIPAFISSRATIVEYKREKTRSMKKPLWEKYFLDILLLGVSAYGLYSYGLRQETLKATGAEAAQFSVDPMLFIISTLFILGAGLIILRIYPYFVRLTFAAGKKHWPPALYASFIQVGRSKGQDQTLMLFLILTLSIGLFNANAARTLNNNIEEKIKYSTGADLNIMGLWESNQVPTSSTLSPGEENSQGPGPAYGNTKEAVEYSEPPFEAFNTLVGAEGVTKVFRQKEIIAQLSTREAIKGKTELLALIPHEFGKTAWFRRDLLPSHWFNYLNLLAMEDPRAALVSKDIRDKYDVDKGDSLWISWGDQGYLEIIVYEFIDYWPSFNPNILDRSGDRANLIVARLDYIQANSALEPYEVWIKKAPGTSSQDIYEEMVEKDIKIERLTDSNQEIIKAKNDPMLQGINGALTLGFMVTMSISTLGFLIYWILSIRQRVLQFGIFRAIGLSVGKIIGLLAWEQVLISAAAVFIGIFVGGLTSRLFVPLLQLAYGAVDQVPPFKVIALGKDYMKVYGVVAFMLFAAMVLLGFLISKIKIHQAIKLGED